MNPRLSDLYMSSQEEYQLTLIAGQKGLYKMVSWVYQAEDITTTDFLRGNELVITTGLCSSAYDHWLISFVHKLIDRSCSGLILNIGQYIHASDITGELLTLCDEQDFPLFIMPWDIHISDLMQDYCHKIFTNNYLEKTLTKLFCHLIFNQAASESIIPLLNANGFASDTAYCVMIFSNLKTPANLKNILNQQNIGYHVFIQEGSYVVICKDITYALLDSFFCAYYKFCDTLIQHDPSISYPYTGISEITGHLSQLNFCYMEARHALGIAEYTNTRNIYFKDQGIFRILLSVPNRDLLSRYYTDILHPLLKYDAKNNSSLTETFRTYLNCSGSIQETADRLYTHRNTINYRMKRIRVLLKDDLETPNDSFQYKLAFYIQELLNREPDIPRENAQKRIPDTGIF